MCVAKTCNNKTQQKAEKLYFKHLWKANKMLPVQIWNELFTSIQHQFYLTENGNRQIDTIIYMPAISPKNSYKYFNKHKINQKIRLMNNLTN